MIVDDHAVVREGLERILAKCADLEVVGSASSGEEALSLAAALEPDLVLLDLSLPGMHGLEVLAALQRTARPPRVVVLTVHDDDDIVLGRRARRRPGLRAQERDPRRARWPRCAGWRPAGSRSTRSWCAPCCAAISARCSAAF